MIGYTKLVQGSKPNDAARRRPHLLPSLSRLQHQSPAM